MRVEVHVLSYQEEAFIAYNLRHYTSFAECVILHDSFSTDRTREIAKSFGVEIRDWDTGGKLNDRMAAHLKSNAWRGTDADWVIVCDTDEILYPLQGWFTTLAAYEADGVAVVKTRGFEMFSETFPTTEGQVYDEVTQGSEDSFWYGKPTLLNPRLIRDLQYHVGAHDAVVTLKDGRRLTGFQKSPPTEPETYLLHCHHLGGEKRIADRYTVQQSRLSDENWKRNWGNTLESGPKHAQTKRSKIIPNLKTVIQ